MQRRIIGIILITTALGILVFPAVKRETDKAKVKRECEAVLEEKSEATSFYEGKEIPLTESYSEEATDATETEPDIEPTVMAVATETVSETAPAVFGYAEANCFNATRDLADYDAIPSLGSIKIPSLGISYDVYKYATDATLDKGIGHIEYSDVYDGVNVTHSFVMAHSGIYGEEFFSHIDDLKEGDEVYWFINGEKVLFTVTGSEIVEPEDVIEIIRRTENKHSTLTLVTCTPYGVNNKRLLVHTQQLEDKL